MIEINQRSERDWVVYVDNKYRGTVSRIGVRQFEFVATHSLKRFPDREAAIEFLVAFDLLG